MKRTTTSARTHGGCSWKDEQVDPYRAINITPRAYLKKQQEGREKTEKAASRGTHVRPSVLLLRAATAAASRSRTAPRELSIPLSKAAAKGRRRRVRPRPRTNAVLLLAQGLAAVHRPTTTTPPKAKQLGSFKGDERVREEAGKPSVQASLPPCPFSWTLARGELLCGHSRRHAGPAPDSLGAAIGGARTPASPLSFIAHTHRLFPVPNTTQHKHAHTKVLCV
uniref:Uncharacterized protein n=1 Tax=Leersia perrieri TaxID=77586 RepID=A0A0D9VQY9_9ORYZ